jgi:hypothetical protein
MVKSSGTGVALGTDGAAASAALSALLVTSLEALAATGQIDAACRLAGRACAALRKDDPQGWRKFNALLHRLNAPSFQVPAEVANLKEAHHGLHR